MSQEAAPNRRRKPWVWPVEAREDRCAICLDRVTDTVRALPCRHIFCRECIEQWAANSPSCPLCRQRILAKQCLDWRPSARPPTCSPQGKLQRTRERREARSARRSRSVPPRSPPRSRSRSPRRLARSSSWHGELNQRSRFEELPPQDEDREWLRRVARERQMGAGEHARQPDGPHLWAGGPTSAGNGTGTESAGGEEAEAPHGSSASALADRHFPALLEKTTGSSSSSSVPR